MRGWDDAAASIAAAFEDVDDLIYTQGGVTLPPFPAIRSDRPAPGYSSPAQSERQVAYEIRREHLPDRPSARDTFIHRGRRWRVGNVEPRDEVGAWVVIVTDEGRA